jgi:hypothetical protein
MPGEVKEYRDDASPGSAVSQTEALVRARVSVDQIRLSRLATQSAIKRSRDSLSETRAALVTVQHSHLMALRRKFQKQIDALKPKAVRLVEMPAARGRDRG